VKVKEQYLVKISNSFAASESVDDICDGVNINKAWVTENLGYYELKHHQTWLDDECSKLLDQRKQAKFQWLENSNHTN
jgi:hypothetical protein